MKRAISLILCLVMLLSTALLMGCGGKRTPPPAATAPSPWK